MGFSEIVAVPTGTWNCFTTLVSALTKHPVGLFKQEITDSGCAAHPDKRAALDMIKMVERFIEIGLISVSKTYVGVLAIIRSLKL
jgi:hypothetical protein